MRDEVSPCLPCRKASVRHEVCVARSTEAREQHDEMGSTKAWKLFLLLPRLLFHRPPRGGLIPKGQLQERFTDFAAGRWAIPAPTSPKLWFRWGSCQQVDTPSKALLSRLGGVRPLSTLQNPLRCPEPRQPLADDFVRRGPLFELDFDLFSKNLRVSCRGAASGPSGMTSEHLCPLLQSEKDVTLFWQQGSLSVAALTMCPMQSVPALVDKAH